jgi:hypothetical protein
MLVLFPVCTPFNREEFQLASVFHFFLGPVLIGQHWILSILFLIFSLALTDSVKGAVKCVIFAVLIELIQFLIPSFVILVFILLSCFMKETWFRWVFQMSITIIIFCPKENET